MSHEFHEMDEKELWEALDGADSYDRADILRQIATWRAGDEDNANACQLLEESCELFSTLNETREEGITRVVLAKTYSEMNLNHKAREMFLQSAGLLRMHGLDKEIGDCYYYASRESRTLNEYGIAASQMSQAEDFYISAGTSNAQAIAAAGRELGWLLQHIGGRDDEALDAFERAIEVSKGQCHPHFVNDIRQKYLVVLCYLHKYDEALIQARQSLAVCRACSCGQCVGGALMDLGMVYSNLQDSYLATTYFLEALDIAKANNDSLSQLRANVFFAQMRIQSDKLQARQLLNECVDLAQALGSDAGLADTYRSFGILNLKEERFEEAADYFAKSANIWNSNGELCVAEGQFEIWFPKA